MNQKLFFKYLFLLAFVLIYSCRNDGLQSVSKPKNLLSREKMAEIISDMHLAEGAIQLQNVSPDSTKRMNAGYNAFIFKKHQIQAAQFESSFDYYLSIPMEMDSVYMLVVDVLNNKDSRSRGISIAPKNDSLLKP